MITGVMVFIYGLWCFVLIVLAYTWVSRMKREIKNRVNLKKKSRKTIDGLIPTKYEHGPRLFKPFPWRTSVTWK